MATAAVPEQERVNAWPPRGFFRYPFRFLHHVLLTIVRIVQHLGSTMALRRDSKIFVEPGLQQRCMVHLKTKEECRLSNETIQVWTVELPSKYAEGILRVIKAEVPGQDSIDLQHLRRFAKPKFLPAHVLGERDVVKDLYAVPHAWESTPPAVMQAPGTTAWEWPNAAKGRLNPRPSTLYLLVCPTKVVDLKTIHHLLLEHAPFCSSPDSWAYPLEIKAITVPLLAPTSPQQAAAWSQQYWPTFYRKTNPFGAHPASIEKAEVELQSPEESNIGVEEALALAETVGDETLRLGVGIGTGCIVTERVDGHTSIIAAAGDARFKPVSIEADGDTSTPCCQGNMMGHAVMRAIGMVGRKRLRCASQPIKKGAAKAESNFEACGLVHDEAARDAFFLDLPITSLEEQHFAQDNLKPDGYLCLKLEVFLTHEPCVMCCMALVHSRVGRVVFKHRMPKTGGLTAEMTSNPTGPVGLGYGLCWRKELNWQFMCWEYMIPPDEGLASREAGKDSSEKYLSCTAAPNPADDTEADDYQHPSSTLARANVGSSSSFASSHV